VATNAKGRHLVGKEVSRAELDLHADPRFYTWSEDLVNSIKAKKVKVLPWGLTGEVTASEPYATLIEVGGAGRRAFPFFGPALVEEGPGIILILGTAVSKVIK